MRSTTRTLLIACLVTMPSWGCGPPGDRAYAAPSTGPVGAVVPHAEASAHTVELVARTPYLPTYPCGTQCHDDRTPDARPRALVLFHVGREVHHGPALDFCDDCHAMDDVDQLVLLDGVTHVGFDASDALCAQCHGNLHDDWEAGIHGLSTGGWQDHVERRLCTACHDPHTPGDITLTALPVPESARRVHRPLHARGHDAAHDDTGSGPTTTHETPTAHEGDETP
jgi:hypothetical protein